MIRHRATLGMRVTAVVSAALLVQSSVATIAASASTATPRQAQAATPTPTPDPAATKLPPDQLDSLVAPIALYPDPLLAQVLAASTYPLEIVQLQQWMDKNPTIVGDALAAAVEKQGWDPSVQGLAGVHDVVKRLADDIQWTADLGNAFLAQPNDVMDAVQRMRKKASDSGNLKTGEQMKVTTQVVQTKEVIVIQQADPQVIYVPAYNPVVVYGAPIYPYPPIYYPPPYYYGAMAIGFGVGIAMGAFWGGGWGYGPRWGYGSVNINVNNRYVNHYNRNTNINNRTGNSWNHNPSHRGGAPYGDRATANRFGGTARGDSVSSRQNSVRNSSGATARTQPSAGANRTGAGANRATSGVSNLSGSGSARTSAGGSDRVGNRSIPSSSNRSSNAFGGASTSRSTGSAARSASSRGASSVGASRGGGGGRRR